ncbi:Glycerophosphoryl diester phosphodiesterase [compost metagenome]
MTTTPIINFAHRGASGTCPENTMIAFRQAIELGATGIETDVQRTKDGKLVLIHDESLERTTGLPRLVKDVIGAELEALDAGSWFDPSFQGERVPELHELLELGREHGIVLNLELKNGIVPYEGLEAEVVAAVRSFGIEEQVIISSFNHYSLVECHRLAPDIRTGVLYMEGLYRPWEYAQSIGATALHAYKEAVAPEWVKSAAGAGVAYHPFTVNDEEEMRVFLGYGVRGIITDYPERLHSLLTLS